MQMIQQGDVMILKGALEENQWPYMRSVMKLMLAQNPSGVIIDASGLTEVSEAGSRTFMDASSFIQAENARVVVAALPERILTEIKKIPGVRSQLVVASSVAEARSSLETGGGVALSPQAKPAVVVPLIGAWSRVLSIAALEASNRRTEVYLVYVLQVPRNLPLGEPVPELEHEAQKTLAEAEKMLRSKGVKVRKTTTRSRDITEGVARFASETKAQLLVVGYYKDDLASDGGRCPMVGTLCADTDCDVAIYCMKR